MPLQHRLLGGRFIRGYRLIDLELLDDVQLVPQLTALLSRQTTLPRLSLPKPIQSLATTPSGPSRSAFCHFCLQRHLLLRRRYNRAQIDVQILRGGVVACVQQTYVRTRHRQLSNALARL